jgi:hypothetical protein
VKAEPSDVDPPVTLADFWATYGTLVAFIGINAIRRSRST